MKSLQLLQWKRPYSHLILVLLLYKMLRNLKEWTRPFSDDIVLMKSIPWTIISTISRRYSSGPLYPEWSFAFEIFQSLMKSVAIIFGPKLVKPAENARQFRKNSERLFRPLAWLSTFRSGYTQQTQVIDNIPVVWLKPKTPTTVSSSSPYILLYFHGGGYCVMSPTSHVPMLCRILQKTQELWEKSYPGESREIQALLVDYRKAPEHVFPAALEDARCCYEYLITTLHIPPSKIIVAGDSAGGGLALTLLLDLRAAGARMPAASMCISPYSNVLEELSDQEHDIIAPPQASIVKHVFLKDQELCLMHSPLLNNLSGLPPTFIQVGTLEILYPQILRLASRAHADGSPVVLDIHTNMPHIFPFFDAFLLPYSEVGIAALGKFAAHHFQQHSTMTTTDSSILPGPMKRNVSSVQLGKENCFHPPDYMLSPPLKLKFRRVQSANVLNETPPFA